LDAFISDEIPIEENILPTSRPFDSVFGLSQSILDTPRSVTIISREQLDAISITDVRDFTKLTSSSFTRTNFGAPAQPDIRTQISDTMWNGIRRGLTSNGNGLPINFNAVESVNIVKGPASVVHGASQYVGGYIDFITKRPYFDEFGGEIAVTLGQYDKRMWTIDFGGPISEKLAYRISYSGEDSEGYFDHSFKRTQALYAGVTFRPNDKYELFVNGEVLYAHYTENFGINRPAQDLIDNGNYITGVNNNPDPSLTGGDYLDDSGNVIDFGNDGQVPGAQYPAAAQSDPQNSRWVTAGYPVTNRMAWGPTTKVDRAWRLIKPGDDSDGYSINLQAIQTFTLDDESKIVSNSYFNYINRDTFSSYNYSEIIDPSWRLESRLEYQRSGEKYDLNVGAAVNYQEVTAYNHFFFEPANVWDLSVGNDFIDVYNSVNWPDAPAVPGHPGRYATEGIFNGDTSISEAFGFGPFAQLNYAISDNFTILGGVRVDYLSVSGRDPLVPVWATADDDISVSLLNYNISPLWKLNDTFSVYFTYNYSENPGGTTANGGGYGQLEDEDGDSVYTFSKSRFEQETELFEVGAKATYLEGKLFVGAALFEQVRTNLSIDGSIDEFTIEGFEIEANYQPNKNWYFTASWSITDSTVNGPQFDVNNTSPWLPGQTPFFILPPGEYQRQGSPKHTANALISYKADAGYGIQVAGFITSEMNNNVAGSLVIPMQFNIDTTIYYETETWKAALTFLNVTNEENWSPPNAVYGGESIFAELPVRVEGTLTWKF
tara:strand:- start:30194 stop:32512 length:2319 start_codon:yes stop_codon:yes gene_type:complete